MNPLRDHAGLVVITFCYPDYTVGLGIPPSHAPVVRTKSSLQRLVGYTTDREFTCILFNTGVTLPRRLDIWLPIL